MSAPTIRISDTRSDGMSGSVTATDGTYTVRVHWSVTDPERTGPDAAAAEARRRIRVARAGDELLAALEAGVSRLETIQETHPEIQLDEDLDAYRAAIAAAGGSDGK